MLQEENAMSKQELTDTVKQKLNESGFAVTDKEISVALKMITTGSGKLLRLK
jgi:hypothetical protein